MQIQHLINADSSFILSDYWPLFKNEMVETSACFDTWDLPVADSYDDVAFIYDVNTQSSFTITWTADTNTRNCEYDSSV